MSAWQKFLDETFPDPVSQTLFHLLASVYFYAALSVQLSAPFSKESDGSRP
jgi:hypothetical protein